MNTNKIYFIQTKKIPTDVRQTWVISSPSEDRAQALLIGEGWVDKEDTIILTSEEVMGIVDTEDWMEGETYIKIHN